MFVLHGERQGNSTPNYNIAPIPNEPSHSPHVAFPSWAMLCWS